MARILYVLHTFESAGSQHSMLAQAKSMRSLGHEIHFIGSRGPFEHDLMKEDIPCHLRPYSAFTPLSVLGIIKLALVIKRIRPDLLHSSGYWPHIECLFMKTLFKVPVISTIAGGPFFGKPLIPKCPLISYSAELKDEIVRHFGAEYNDMLVMKNRMDLSSPPPAVSHMIGKKISAPGNILFISRLDRDKEQSIDHFLREMVVLHRSYGHVVGRILGGGEIEAAVRLQASRINHEFGSGVVTLLGHRRDIFPHIRESDIVVGLGRSAMESMVSERPVLIPCSDGSLSLVVKENADKHAHYNFAGRQPRTDEDRIRDAENLKRLFRDPEYYDRVAGFSRQYIIDNYDVRGIQDRMQALYLEEIAKAARDLHVADRLGLFCECMKAYVEGARIRLRNLSICLRPQVIRVAALGMVFFRTLRR